MSFATFALLGGLATWGIAKVKLGDAGSHGVSTVFLPTRVHGEASGLHFSLGDAGVARLLLRDGVQASLSDYTTKTQDQAPC